MTTSGTTIPGLAFYDALVNNSLVELKRCVELHKIDLNARLSHVRKRNHTDLCPVHLVAYKGYFAMLHYLIQNGINVHQPTLTLQRRAVHFAALRHQVSCLQMLLNAGAQLDARDTFGNTPLHYAAEDGDGALLSLLLNNGASVDSQDITNKTPLMKAARSGKLWAVRRLIAFGANVNVKDRNDETALHFACRQGSTEITSMLIKAGARLNAQNQIGLTPLMEAVSYNQREAVSLMVKQRGVDLYKRDFCTGDTALHIAVKKNYIHMVEILLQAGNWYIEYNYNNLGESFVHDVIAYNRLDLLRLFLAYNYDFDRPAKRLPASILGAIVPEASSSNTVGAGGSFSNTCEKSPFQLALERGHLDLARILADVGCYRIKLPITSGPFTLPLSLYTTSALQSNNSTPSWPNVASLSNSSSLARRYSGLLEVKSLKKWCRRAIRQLLGFRLIDALPQLPLPIALKDFLLLRDIDWYVCWSTAMAHRGPSNTSELAIIVPPRYTHSPTQRSNSTRT
ncbi:hypothetical protein CSKR_202086 [Clonorchis sinensis]|uniref:Uncharacterized protein n=2 Tax=Clonorchis sinensis TaxID=79923 RepID=A0A8T1LV46_CLOSI|nr:hypothetical protein CSKR_202086 [Clonorchis sinensis]GAA55565.1 putative ankyrin repeat protein RF_0381 [Clonorchis sinensis]